MGWVERGWHLQCNEYFTMQIATSAPNEPSLNFKDDTKLDAFHFYGTKSFLMLRFLAVSFVILSKNIAQPKAA